MGTAVGDGSWRWRRVAGLRTPRWWGSSLRFDRAPYGPYWFPGTRPLVERLRFGSLLRPPTYSRFRLAAGYRVPLPNLARQRRRATSLRADGRRRPTSASLAALVSLLSICLPTASFVLPMEHIEASLLPIIALSTACFSSRCSRKHTAILTAAGNAPGSSVLTPPGGSCADKMIISIEMRTCAAALATCVVSQWLLLLPLACTSSQPRRPWSVCPLASRFRSQLQELQVRLKRAILEYVILAGSPRNP